MKLKDKWEYDKEPVIIKKMSERQKKNSGN